MLVSLRVALVLMDHVVDVPIMSQETDAELVLVELPVDQASTSMNGNFRASVLGREEIVMLV